MNENLTLGADVHDKLRDRDYGDLLAGEGEK